MDIEFMQYIGRNSRAAEYKCVRLCYSPLAPSQSFFVSFVFPLAVSSSLLFLCMCLEYRVVCTTSRRVASFIVSYSLCGCERWCTPLFCSHAPYVQPVAVVAPSYCFKSGHLGAIIGKDIATCAGRCCVELLLV